MPPRYAKSEDLLERARGVIPHGIWGHNRFPALLHPGAFPSFAMSGSGCRFRDLDGHEYIDYLCGYGAMITGYANPAVDAAAAGRQVMGDCFAQPTLDSVALAECLVETVSGMDWCAFAKNGSDALATAIVVARAATGRRKLVCARGAYHGSHFWSNWCSPGPGRLIDDSRDVLLVGWNDADELAAVLDRHGQDVAAVLMTPFHHPIAAEAVMPDPGWWEHVESLARRCGALIIVDDVRTGYRLSLAGSHAYFGLDADLVCQSKALGNTYPIAVTLGASGLRQAADAIFAAGTFWGSAAPMAAALENLRQLRDTDGVDRVWALGRRLCDGLERTGAAHGVAVRMTGAPTLPTMTIDGDDGSAMLAFTTAMAELGSFMHPSHNWFISAAHAQADIDETLAHADAVFAATAGAAPLAAVAHRD